MVKSISKIKKIVNKYKEELGRHNIKVSKVILYGSYVQGNPKSYSDIDLIIISKDLGRYPPLKRQELLAQLTINIDAPLEVLGYTPTELKKAEDTIFAQIIYKTGIPIG